jgi:DNA repair protein RadA
LSDELERIKNVGPSTASKLKSAGLTTVEAVAVTPVREIMQKTGLGHETALKICEEARRLMKYGFVKAAELWERRKNLSRCSTGSKRLDKILGGGIETQAVTEFIGDYGVGKTQICMMLSFTAQLPREQGGLNGNIIYLDTEGTFSPERVYQIATERGLDGKRILDGIVVARAYNSDHQCLLIDHLFKKCPEENAKLVVVDSMVSHLRGEYPGRENIAQRQQILNQYLHKLLRLSEAYNLAVVITNQVVSNPATFYVNLELPVGGHIMAHACTHRAKLSRAKGGGRVAKIIDSPYLPEDKASFIITAKGIEDTDKEFEEEEPQPQTLTQKI